MRRGPAESLPSDPNLRAMLERAMTAARSRAAREGWPAAEAPSGRPESEGARPVRAVRLASDRACVETNLARKGLWRPGPVQSTGGGELVRLLDATDQLGLVQRIDGGPPLGALAFDVIVWACSRWREHGEPGERHVPLTLEAVAEDLGWKKGGGAAAELAQVLDTLRQATFKARVYNARLSEVRIDTFGLVDRWERGERHHPGRPARPGFLVLGDWLHEQLVRGHVTFVSWAELRGLRSGTARRLLVYLDAERFAGEVWRRGIDGPLLTTLGIGAAKPFHQRATLRRAAAAVTKAQNRYQMVIVEAGPRRGDYVLVAARRVEHNRARSGEQGSWCDGTGQSVR